jgi:hypothetical protein
VDAPAVAGAEAAPAVAAAVPASIRMSTPMEAAAAAAVAVAVAATAPAVAAAVDMEDTVVIMGKTASIPVVKAILAAAQHLSAVKTTFCSALMQVAAAAEIPLLDPR